MTNYEHLRLPKLDILPRRPRRGGGGNSKRSDRSSHGSLLLTQVSSLSKDIEEKEHLGINPKLIFKIKVRKNDSLGEHQLHYLGLNLLAKEPKAKQAIVVFADDNCLTKFQNKLESYTGTQGSPGYLDDIEELVPLEAEDRIGPLLKDNPLEPGSVVPLDMELWHTGNKEELRSYIYDVVDEVLRMEPGLGMKVSDSYIGSYICNVRILVNSEMLKILLEEYEVKEIDRRPKPAFELPAEYNITVSDLPEISSPPEEATGVLARRREAPRSTVGEAVPKALGERRDERREKEGVLSEKPLRVYDTPSFSIFVGALLLNISFQC